jgi:hypothetical protein
MSSVVVWVYVLRKPTDATLVIDDGHVFYGWLDEYQTSQLVVS